MVREMKHTEIGEIPVEWKLQTFEETFCVLSNNTLPRAELNDRGGTVRNIHYGDILTRFGEVLDCEKDEIPYLNDVSSLTASAQVLQDGDVILADTAEDDSVGKATEVYGLGKGRMVAGLHTIPCRVKKGDFVPRWLGYYMNSPGYHNQVLPYVTGIKVSSISKTAISETLIAVPPLEEQMAIVSAFSEMDQLLAELKKVVSKLQDFKRGCLYLMFPQGGSDIPQMREPGYDEPWEQRKFSDLVQIERGGSTRPIDDYITDSPKGLNWVKIGDAPTQGHYITKTSEKIRPEGLSKTREVHPGDLILSNSMSFGKPYIMGIDGCIHDGWLLIRNIHNVFDLTFLCHLLGIPQMLEQYRALAAGSTVNNLNKELVGNTVVTIPNIDEQKVLGQCLEQLDHLITLHQQKFDKYAQIKKAMISELITGKIKLV